MKSEDPTFDLLTSFCGQTRMLTVPRSLITLLGDIKPALLLSQIIYWSGKKPDQDGWFYKTYEDWEEELSLTKHEVSRSSDLLREQGLIDTSIRQNSGHPKVHYRFSISGFRKWIVKKTEVDSSKNGNVESEKTGDPNKEQKSTTEEYEQKSSASSPFPISEDNLDLESSVEDFVKNCYSRENRRAKLEKLNTRRAQSPGGICERLREAEVAFGAHDFRAALTNYLHTESDWHRQSKWPIYAFLKDVSRYIPDAVDSVVETHADETVATQVEPIHPTPTTDTPDSTKGLKTPNLVSRWNELLPDLAVDPELFSHDLSLRDEALISRFDAVCAKVKEVNAGGGTIRFSNLVERPRNGELAGWRKILAGGLDWTASRKPNKNSEKEELVARKRRELEESRAKREKAANAATGTHDGTPVGSV